LWRNINCIFMEIKIETMKKSIGMSGSLYIDIFLNYNEFY
jgi:hypothetical protein